MVRCAQPSTYDTALYGANSFIGSLYICALRCAEEMATRLVRSPALMLLHLLELCLAAIAS